MKSTVTSILALGMLISSCRTELPPLPSGEAPVFTVEFDNPQLNFDLMAGVSNVAFQEETQTEQLVKYYSGILLNQDTSFRINFFAGEVFKPLTISDLDGINALSQVSLLSPELASIQIADLSDSEFSSASLSIDGSSDVSTYDFEQPGIYSLQLEANQNGFDYDATNLVVVGYHNPYQFELTGNINSSGPGIILEGEILNLNQNIQRIEWTCGSNTQTTTGNFVQFPTANSANELSAKVYFSDGVSRTRTIGLGLQNAPKIQDVVYQIESNSPDYFTHKFEILININGENYSSRYATDFTSGAPYLNIQNKTIYTDPITKSKVYLIEANGLVYVKNDQSNETLALPLQLSIGFPFAF